MSSSSEPHEFFSPVSIPPAKNIVVEGMISTLEPGFLGAKTWVRNFAQLVDDEPMVTLRAYGKLDDLLTGKRPRVVYDLSLLIDIVEIKGAEWFELWFANGGIVRLKAESTASDRTRWLAHLLRTSPRVRAMLVADPTGVHERVIGISSNQLRAEPLRSTRSYAVADPDVAEIVGSHSDFTKKAATTEFLPGTANATSISAAIASHTSLSPPPPLSSSLSPRTRLSPSLSSRTSEHVEDSQHRRLPFPPPPSFHMPTYIAPSLPPSSNPPAMPSATFAREIAERVSSNTAHDIAETHHVLEGLSHAVTTLAVAHDKSLERLAEVTRLLQGSIAGAARAASASVILEQKLDAMGAAIMSLTSKVDSMAKRVEHNNAVSHENESVNVQRIEQAVRSLQSIVLNSSSSPSNSPHRRDAVTPVSTGRRLPPSTATPNLQLELEQLQTQARNQAALHKDTAVGLQQEAAVMRTLLDQANNIRSHISKLSGVDVTHTGSASITASKIPAQLRVRDDIMAQLNRLRAVESSITNSTSRLNSQRQSSPARNRG